MNKLQSQIDFLNKENQRLDRQVEILKGDENGRMAATQYFNMKKELDEIMFENTTLRKDLNAAVDLLKDRETALQRLLDKEELREKQESESQHLLQQ